MIDLKEKIRQYSEKSENEVLQYLFNYWGFEISDQPFKLIVGNYEKSIKPDKNGNEFGFFQEVSNTLKFQIFCFFSMMSSYTSARIHDS